MDVGAQDQATIRQLIALIGKGDRRRVRLLLRIKRVRELLDTRVRNVGADPAVPGPVDSPGGLRDGYSHTALYDASMIQNNARMIRMLVEAKASIDRACDEALGKTPLNSAVYGGHAANVECLLKAKADFEIADHKGFTPLHSAAQENRSACLRLLIDAKADPTRCCRSLDESTEGGHSPLRSAAYDNNSECVRMLLKAKASVNRSEDAASGGATAFLAACDLGSTESFELLLEAKANINQGDSLEGRTPLILLAQRGHTSLAVRLVRLGADLSRCAHVNGELWTPRMVAESTGHYGLATFLKSAEFLSPLARACLAHDPNVLAAFLSSAEAENVTLACLEEAGRTVFKSVMFSPKPHSSLCRAARRVLRDASMAWSPGRNQRLWPPSFRRGARTLQLVGRRLLLTTGGRAPPESIWIVIVTFCSRDWFVVDPSRQIRSALVQPVAAPPRNGISGARPRPCCWCGAEGARKRCRGCRVALYCSVECSVKAWPSHRDQCKQLRAKKVTTAAKSARDGVGHQTAEMISPTTTIKYTYAVAVAVLASILCLFFIL